MLLNNKLLFNDKYDIVLGSRDHYCEYCVREESTRDKSNRFEVITRLKGNYIGQKLLRVCKRHGEELMICEECINKIKDAFEDKENEKK